MTCIHNATSTYHGQNYPKRSFDIRLGCHDNTVLSIASHWIDDSLDNIAISGYHHKMFQSRHFRWVGT